MNGREGWQDDNRDEYSGRGACGPCVYAHAGREDITQNFSDRLIGLTMTDNRGFEADQLDIALDDTDGLVELPPRGASLTLWLGWQGSALVNKGSFTVDEIEHRGAPRRRPSGDVARIFAGR
ncbi:hypothetical protein ACLB1N_05165 [Escherichia coli]